MCRIFLSQRNFILKFLAYIILVPSRVLISCQDHHHVATNTWLGTDIQEANSEELGLDHFKLKLPSKPDFNKLLQQLKSKNIEIISDTNDNRISDSVFFHDPDRIKIQISHL